MDHQLGPASSPAVFQDWLYLVRDGCDLQYVAALAKDTGRTHNPVAQSQLEATVIATPAAVGNAIFLRSDTHLYRIQTPPASP